MAITDAHIYSRISQCRLIDLTVFPDVNGKLAVVDYNNVCPFALKRFFFLYDVPYGAMRGGHSHFLEQQFIIAVTGAFDVTVGDGAETKVFHLNRPSQGLYIPAGLWRELENFTSGAVSVVLSSTEYDEADYVREYNEFLKLTSNKRHGKD